MALDIKKEVEALQKMYTESGSSQYFHAIIYGGFGTGKTTLLRTCRLPVFVDSFDPGGSKVVLDEIQAGKIVVDNRWENEEPKNPTVFEAWDKAYHQRKREGFFNHFGTYCIDSITTFGDAAMNVTLKKAGRAGGYAFQQDYNPTMSMIATAIRDILTLPCDVILLCHEDTDKDESTGRMFVGPAFIGKSARGKTPVYFDELYCAQTKETQGGTNYSLLTRNTGLYKARTRLGRNGKFDMYEEQNIKKLLAKAGFPTEDKPLFKEG